MQFDYDGDAGPAYGSGGYGGFNGKSSGGFSYGGGGGYRDDSYDDPDLVFFLSPFLLNSPTTIRQQ